MSLGTRTAATLDDLHRVEGKAELIDGRIVHLMATGLRPNRIAAAIFISLNQHACATGLGMALTDNMGFAVTRLASGRESFSPDVSYYDGPLPDDDMDFVHGPPTLAVEVRSKGDYGRAAEAAMAAKRADYFEAGTAVVWDVDSIGRCVHVFTSVAPDQPATFREGQEVHAEPAVPGWRTSVDEIFA